MEAFTKISFTKLMKQNPTFYSSMRNQLFQKVRFYEHPTLGEDHPVIAVIEGIAVNTGFMDTQDFYRNSDYNPVLKDGNIYCAFELK